MFLDFRVSKGVEAMINWVRQKNWISVRVYYHYSLIQTNWSQIGLFQSALKKQPVGPYLAQEDTGTHKYLIIYDSWLYKYI